MFRKQSVLCLLLAITYLLALTGCSKSYAGVYETTSSGCTLVINEDGTCMYSETDYTGSGTGVWWVEDDILYFETDNLGYTVYADLSDYPNGLLLLADSSYWHPEFFKKVA